MIGERGLNCRIVAALPVLALLAGCGSLSEQFGGSVWVTPGKYAYHSCKHLVPAERAQAARQKELEELMARAAQGTGGQAIGQMVYRTEYQQTVGERQAIVAELGRKRCSFESEQPSQRSVF